MDNTLRDSIMRYLQDKDKIQPEPTHVMVLRSTCHYYGCNEGKGLAFGRLTPTRNSPARNSHQHQHTHEQNNQGVIRKLDFDSEVTPSTSYSNFSKSVKTTSTVTQKTNSSKDVETFETEDSEVRKLFQNSPKKTKKSNHLENSGQSFLSYSSGYDSSEDKRKTDYTYAKSQIYRRDVDPNKPVNTPNMSRVSLYNYNQNPRSFSHEEEDDVASVSSTNSSKRNHRNHKKPINGLHYATQATSNSTNSKMYRYWSSFISIFSSSISYISSAIFSRTVTSHYESTHFNRYNRVPKKNKSRCSKTLLLWLLLPCLLALGFFLAKPFLVSENGSFFNYIYSPLIYRSVNTSDPEELKNLVKLLIQEELKSHAKFSDIDASLYNLKDTIKGLVDESEDLSMRTRIESSHRTSNDEKTEEQLKKLDQQLDQLQSMALELKNCCRNESDYHKAVDERIILFFHKLLNQDSSSEVLGKLAQWLKAYNEEDNNKKLTNLKETIVKEIYDQMLVKKENYTMPDNLEALIWKKVQQALSQYDADKTGKADYALESGGGSVVGTRCTETYVDRDAQFSIFGIPIWQKTNSPRTVIQPGVSPGECWPFRGSQGYIVIKLSTAIIPTAFSVEHIPVALSPLGKIDSAPKEFIVLGLISESDTEGVELGKFTYDADAEPLQTFDVQVQSSGVYRFIELRIESNHGNLEYTCLYRFRVHGRRAYK